MSPRYYHAVIEIGRCRNWRWWPTWKTCGHRHPGWKAALACGETRAAHDPDPRWASFVVHNQDEERIGPDGLTDHEYRLRLRSRCGFLATYWC